MNRVIDSQQALRQRLAELRSELRRVESALAAAEAGASPAETGREAAGDARLDPIQAVGQLSPNLIVIHQDGKIVYANEEVAKALGAPSADALTGEPVLRFVHPDDVPLARRRIATLLQEGGVARAMIERLVRLDGTVIEVEISGAAIEYRGRPAIQVVARDVTETLRARRALERLMSGTTSTGTAFFSDLTRVLCETLGVNRALVAKWNPDSNRLAVLAHWSRAGKVGHSEYDPSGTPCERVLRDGLHICHDHVQELFPQDLDLQKLNAVSYYGVAIPSTNSKTEGVLCILDDKPMERTEWLLPVMQAFALRAASEFNRLEYEQRMENSEVRFRKLFEHSHDGMLLLDLKTHEIVGANQKALEMFGVSSASLSELSLEMLRLDDERNCLNSFLQRVPPHGVIRNCEAVVSAPGRNTPCEISASRVLIGGRPKILLQLRDISERRQTRQLLAMQHRVLERLARGDDLHGCLSLLCQELEQLIPRCLATVMTVVPGEQQLRLLVAPSLPKKEFQAFTDLPISLTRGSCAAAAFTGRPVIAANTESDPRWKDAREVAERFKIAACWSVPFFCHEQVAGTVALSHPSPREPTAFEREVLDAASNLASVAEQREAVHRRLRHREEQLKGILGTATDIIWSVDRQGRVLYFNRQAVGEQLTVGESLVESLPSGWGDPLRRAMERVALNQLPYQFEVTHHDEKGDRWFSFRVGPVVRGGNCDGYTICASETTGQKDVEQQLRVNYERFRALAESAPAVIFLIDETGKLSYVNSRWEELTGYDRWSWKHGQDPSDMVHPLDRDMVLTKWRLAFSQATRLELEYRLVRADGVTRWVYNVAEPLRDEHHRCIGFVGFSTDITPLKESVENLRQRDAELAHLSRLATMGQMVAELSHEINQPLYSISNYAGALTEFLKSKAPQDFALPIDWAERIGKIAADAGEIIRRLRSFTTHPSPKYSRYELTESVREAASLLEWQLRKANITLQLVGFDQPHWVTADRVAIQQVIVNLLKNACEVLDESSSTGQPAIVLSIQHDDKAVVLEVTDNGPGLPVDQPELLFHAFMSFRPDGSGMGLAVSRAIIEQHHGEIWARSNKTTKMWY